MVSDRGKRSLLDTDDGFEAGEIHASKSEKLMVWWLQFAYKTERMHLEYQNMFMVILPMILGRFISLDLIPSAIYRLEHPSYAEKLLNPIQQV